MNRQQWANRISSKDAIRRAGGRNRYNAARWRVQALRRCALVRLLSLKGDLPHGEQTRLAERFKVSRSVISRDVAWARAACAGMTGSGLMPRFTIRGRGIGFEWVYRG